MLELVPPPSPRRCQMGPLPKRRMERRKPRRVAVAMAVAGVGGGVTGGVAALETKALEILVFSIIVHVKSISDGD